MRLDLPLQSEMAITLNYFHLGHYYRHTYMNYDKDELLIDWPPYREHENLVPKQVLE